MEKETNGKGAEVMGNSSGNNSSPSNSSRNRDRILGKIRRALDAAEHDSARAFMVQKRLKGHKRNLVPSRASLPAVSRARLFQTMLEAQSATVAHITSPDALPGAVAQYLASRNLGKIITTGDDPLFDRLDWKSALIARSSAASSDTALADVPVSLSRAHYGVSETGTLFLLSGPQNPTSLNFLPSTQIITVHERDIVGCYEEAWDGIRQGVDMVRRGASALPRTVNMISGPSRTGDIEQTIVLGAHGPKHLHVIISRDG